ncbi:MAG: hypothetical protein DIZ77_08290 [endosymbiont of Seepiophila jonesi]|uniref:Uncharacterized protein n=1 Tax=endosymbiont of Lamellibrachia luymesi TaxID=2200907 RepID=A0A370DNF1_9GAMM|nr:MAG: hypothetical protein DIZ79_16455 [endosymbiont of Lamellibrachia luymesi]RDH92455.1 MAG: hypothetical protein DIZ77_08290 [endosymbiont of Seepiophila jonesi]
MTLLRITRHQIWPNPEAAPEPFSGTITVVSAAGSSDAPAREDTTESHTDSGESGDAPPTATLSSASADEKAKDQKEFDVGTLEASMDQPCPFKGADPGEQKDAGEQFLTWLRAGLASGDIIINDVRA